MLLGVMTAVGVDNPIYVDACTMPCVVHQKYWVNLTLIAAKQTLHILFPYYILNNRKKS